MLLKRRLAFLSFNNKSKKCIHVFTTICFVINFVYYPIFAQAKAEVYEDRPFVKMLAPLSPKIADKSSNKKDVIESHSKAHHTLLIPLTPKIDYSQDKSKNRKIEIVSQPIKSPTKAVKNPIPKTSTTPNVSTAQAPKPIIDTSADKLSHEIEKSKTGSSESRELKQTPEHISAENGMLDEGVPHDALEEDTVLQGTVQIVADDTEYDSDKNTFLGTGNAVAIIAGQDSRLEADTILYDQNSQTLDARGSVKILRQGQLTTGSSFRFKVNSDEYLITDPDTEMQGTTIIARKGYGTKEGLSFKKGTMQLPQPIHIFRNALYGPLSSAEESMEKTIHPDAYIPSKPSFKFKARKMTYENYKDAGNLTVFGGRLMMGNFGLPVPKFTATVGQDNSRVTFPVTPVIGNNLQVGGTNIGPSFNYAMGKDGVLSWAPLLQIGGRNVNNESNSSKIGAGVRINLSTKRLNSHLAYGSVSNLLVADLKYMIRDGLLFQSGINRFVNDGLFGMRRPRLLGELVHNWATGNIPFLMSLNFRTSAGWAQDQPSLLNLTPQFRELFNTTGKTGRVSAYRVQEQISAVSKPVFSIGDNKRGVQMALFGGVAAKGYSTGDSMLMGQFGPIINAHFNRVRLQGGYTQSGVSGKSPFTFDEFIQGTRSCFFGGDVKISKWLTVGANMGYNLNSKLFYQRGLTAAIGPDDFKILLSRDTIRGINRFGFDVLYGAPIPYDKLVLKGRPDAGQLGGI
jgi:hypothetical protein